MTEHDAPRISVVGLGNMGLPMAARLAGAGFDVTGTDLSPAHRHALIERGGAASPTAVEAAAEADVLILMLPDSDAVEQVLLADGAAAAIAPGSVVVDMSSSEPLRTRELARHLAGTGGIDLVDAPVSGGVTGAVAGTLTIMTGGDAEPVQRVRPVLEVLGTPVPTGPVGSGHALKALNNLLSATHLLVTSEAMRVGREFGLDPAVMLAAINGSSGRSGSTENKWPNFILPATFDSGFALALMLKDMRIATDLADALGVPSVLGQRAVELWGRAAAEWPGADHTEIARWLDSGASDGPSR